MTPQTQIEEKWGQICNQLESQFGKSPNMEAVLFLVGVNELRSTTRNDFNFAKNEKEDLIHIGVCTLLSLLGYYSLDHYDEDGWPHFNKLKDVNSNNTEEQEELLKEGAVIYFKDFL